MALSLSLHLVFESHFIASGSWSMYNRAVLDWFGTTLIETCVTSNVCIFHLFEMAKVWCPGKRKWLIK